MTGSIILDRPGASPRPHDLYLYGLVIVNRPWRPLNMRYKVCATQVPVLCDIAR